MSSLDRVAASSPSVFLSYARDDSLVVRAFADALEGHGVQVLLDVDFLRPGQRWETVILDHVRSADALAFFVSPMSLNSRWVETELVAFARSSERQIFPILIDGTGFEDLPSWLSDFQAVILGDVADVQRVAGDVAEALFSSDTDPTPLPAEAEYRAERLASDLADDLRGTGRTDDESAVPSAVFLVHGHDHSFRDEAESHLRSLGIEPVVLSKVGGTSLSLFQKFATLANEAKFAVVLLTADDFGAPRRQFEAGERGGEKTLKFRARENVILELGFFYGQLGWERVFVVQKPAEHVWPDFERPSDLQGIVFAEVSEERDWRDELAASLAEAGLASTGD